ncbi:MAG: RnfABCDGE type electron transport complex subunit B, partial [Clostridiales bacterium]|nr:RnfABCDGE type electron transport complex subunit B [Clostridiales bacterium]
MDFRSILYPVLALGTMGLLFGVLLACASKIFAVDTDERLPLIIEALPGANCGGCGFAGCSNYASEIATGRVPINKCPVGGTKSAKRIAEIMG